MYKVLQTGWFSSGTLIGIVFHVNSIIFTEPPHVLCGSLLKFLIKVFSLTKYHLSNEEDSSLHGWRSASGLSVECSSFS